MFPFVTSLHYDPIKSIFTNNSAPDKKGYQDFLEIFSIRVNHNNWSKNIFPMLCLYQHQLFAFNLKVLTLNNPNPPRLDVKLRSKL